MFYTGCGAAYKEWGECTQVFQFPRAFQVWPKTEEEENIRLLEWWKAPDHFDMLIRSFQTAGICTCNDSNFAFFYAPTRIERWDTRLQLLENDESVCLLITENSVFISKCTPLIVDLNAPLLCVMGQR